MERAIKKRLYVYTIGMFLATVVVVSVITIYGNNPVWCQ